MPLFLAVLLWILLGLLALVALLLVVPLVAAVEYREGAVTVRVQILGVLRIRVYPLRPKKEKPAGTPQPAPPPAQQPAEPKHKFHLTLEKLQSILSAAGAFMRRVFAALRIRQIILIVPVHRDDAAQTAIACGQTQAWLGGGIAALRNFLDMRVTQIRVLPDFTGEIKAGTYFSCKIGASPIIIIIAALYALIQLKNDHVL